MFSQLTTKDLLNDEIATDLGIWFHTTHIHGKAVDFTILQQSNNRYLLGLTGKARLVGEAPTLDGIVSIFNNFVRNAQLHDVTAIVDTDMAKTRIVLGR